MAEDIGWDVTATRLTRRPAHGRPLALDVRDAAAVEHAFAESAPDAVVHCAYVHLGPAATETTVRGSRNVARAAQHVGARLVHMSTDLVFDGEPTRAYTEEDQPRPISEYGAAKAEAERQVAHACPQAVLVRTGLIYGGPIPGQHERLVLDALDDAADVVFFTDEIRCPVLLSELGAALIELLRLDVAGPLHVSGPDAVSRYEFACRIAAAHGRDPKLVCGGPGNRTDRPRDCSLDCSRARTLLTTRLRGVRTVLSEGLSGQ